MTLLNGPVVAKEFQKLEKLYFNPYADNKDILLRLEYMINVATSLWLEGIGDGGDVNKIIKNSLVIAHEVGRREMSKQNYLVERQILIGQLVSKGISIDTTNDSIIILDPEDKPKDYDWAKWQGLLKRAALYNQNGKCLACNGYFYGSGHLHHCLIPKSRARGMDDNWLIHHSFNVVVVHVDCHIEKPDLWAKLMQEIYPIDMLKDWYFNFPVKTKLSDIF